jgi:hypothetical protein
VVSYQLSGVSGQRLAIGGWRLADGGWLLAIGGWLLAIGCWLLAIGGWLMAICHTVGHRFGISADLLLKTHEKNRCFDIRQLFAKSQ